MVLLQVRVVVSPGEARFVIIAAQRSFEGRVFVNVEAFGYQIARNIQSGRRAVKNRLEGIFDKIYGFDASAAGKSKDVAVIGGAEKTLG